VGESEDVGVGEGETAVEVATNVALLHGTFTPTLSVLLVRMLAPERLIWEVPIPFTTKVKVARTPDDSADVVAEAKASLNPP